MLCCAIGSSSLALSAPHSTPLDDLCGMRNVEARKLLILKCHLRCPSSVEFGIESNGDRNEEQKAANSNLNSVFIFILIRCCSVSNRH